MLTSTILHSCNYFPVNIYCFIYNLLAPTHKLWQTLMGKLHLTLLWTYTLIIVRTCTFQFFYHSWCQYLSRSEGYFQRAVAISSLSGRGVILGGVRWQTEHLATRSWSLCNKASWWVWISGRKCWLSWERLLEAVVGMCGFVRSWDQRMLPISPAVSRSSHLLTDPTLSIRGLARATLLKRGNGSF